MRTYKISTQEELNNLNEKWFKHNPQDRNLKWSGCNYYKNKGNNEHEPLGTAQSMHDCEGCSKFNICKIKQDTPTWFWNDEIEIEMNTKWDSMFN